MRRNTMIAGTVAGLYHRQFGGWGHHAALATCSPAMTRRHRALEVRSYSGAEEPAGIPSRSVRRVSKAPAARAPVVVVVTPGAASRAAATAKPGRHRRVPPAGWPTDRDVPPTGARDARQRQQHWRSGRVPLQAPATSNGSDRVHRVPGRQQ